MREILHFGVIFPSFCVPFHYEQIFTCDVVDDAFIVHSGSNRIRTDEGICPYNGSVCPS